MRVGKSFRRRCKAYFKSVPLTRVLPLSENIIKAQEKFKFHEPVRNSIQRKDTFILFRLFSNFYNYCINYFKNFKNNYLCNSQKNN